MPFTIPPVGLPQPLSITPVIESAHSWDSSCHNGLLDRNRYDCILFHGFDAIYLSQLSTLTVWELDTPLNRR